MQAQEEFSVKRPEKDASCVAELVLPRFNAGDSTNILLLDKVPASGTCFKLWAGKAKSIEYKLVVDSLGTLILYNASGPTDAQMQRLLALKSNFNLLTITRVLFGDKWSNANWTYQVKFK